MKRKSHVLAVLVLVLILSLPLSAGASDRTFHLAFLVDGSASIPGNDFTIMTDGIAEALENPECVPQDGSLELTIIQFSTDARVEVAPIGIRPETVATVAATVRNMQQLNGATNYDAAFQLAEASINKETDWQVVNIATDGSPNTGETVPGVLRDRAVAAGFDEIDAEAFEVNPPADAAGIDSVLFNEDAVNVLKSLVYPQPYSLHPPDPWPPTAPGWVRQIENTDEFASTVCQKFQAIVQPTPVPPPTAVPPTPQPPTPTEIPEPATLLMLGTGVAALGAYLNRRRGGG